MKKNTLITSKYTAFLVAMAFALASCGGDSGKTTAEKAPAAEETAVEAETVDPHAGHDHGDGHDHDAHGEHNSDMDSLATLGTDLSFNEGSWAWNLQDYMDNGSGEKVFILDQIPFEGDEISVEGKQQLDDLAALLKAHEDMNIEIQGHTKEAKNAVGKTSKKATSKARALWVQTKLSLRGVSGKQMKARGLGDDSLLPGVPGDDDSQRRIAVAMSK